MNKHLYNTGESNYISLKFKIPVTLEIQNIDIFINNWCEQIRIQEDWSLQEIIFFMDLLVIILQTISNYEKIVCDFFLFRVEV